MGSAFTIRVHVLTRTARSPSHLPHNPRWGKHCDSYHMQYSDSHWRTHDFSRLSTDQAAMLLRLWPVTTTCIA